MMDVVDELNECEVDVATRLVAHSASSLLPDPFPSGLRYAAMVLQ